MPTMFDCHNLVDRMHAVFCLCHLDLDLEPMTLICELKVSFWKIQAYRHTNTLNFLRKNKYHQVRGR